MIWKKTFGKPTPSVVQSQTEEEGRRSALKSPTEMGSSQAYPFRGKCPHIAHLDKTVQKKLTG